MNSVRLNNISLKYQRLTTLDSKDLRIMKSEFAAKTQFYISRLKIKKLKLVVWIRR